jgi:hypothetical protein
VEHNKYTDNIEITLQEHDKTSRVSLQEYT